MKEIEHERRDWIIVFIIILFGLLLVLIAGQWALRFAPRWELNTDMGSKLDPSGGFPTDHPASFVKAIGTGILTQPVWLDTYLTPGAVIPTGKPEISTSTPTVVLTRFIPTNTEIATGTPTHTPVYFPPTRAVTKDPATSVPTSTLIPNNPPTNTPTRTPQPLADLEILNTDDAVTYDTQTSSVKYDVTVSNLGPNGVSGALVTDVFSTNLNVTWSCTASSGASCTASGLSNINDLVDLPIGASITYTVTATLSSYGDDLVSTATVTSPAGVIDDNPTNDTVTDIDQLIIASGFPYGNIGTIPDNNIAILAPGSSLILSFNTPIQVFEGSDNDLVFYELANGSGIAMDLVILEISDGYNWHQIFNWGDNIAETYSNLNIAKLGGGESENRGFTTIPASNVLYPFNSGTISNPSTGVVINVDSLVPYGEYRYIRITSPSDGNVDDGCEIDGIEVMSGITIP